MHTLQSIRTVKTADPRQPFVTVLTFADPDGATVEVRVDGLEASKVIRGWAIEANRALVKVQ